MDQKDFPIQCMVCGQTVKGDSAYMAHMEAHGGSQATGKAIEKNVPKTVPVGQGIPPSPDFMELAALMDSGAPPPAVSTPISKPPDANPTSQAGGKQLQEAKEEPLKLKYHYVGTCDKGHSVNTFEMIVGESYVAVAYCVPCGKQVDAREVARLEKSDVVPQKEFKKEQEAKKNGKIK